MAKKKGGLGRFIGAITGTPYERLLKQVDKLVSEYGDDERKLGKNLKKLVSIVTDNYENENIDEEEHDLIIEAIEEVDPEGRSFQKVSDDEDSFYSGAVPDAPELNLGKRKNLDDLMQSKGNEFVGSYGRDEFEDFKARMSSDFFAESDEAIRKGDHQAENRQENRVFADEQEELERLKQQISQESGMVDPNAEDEDEDEGEDLEGYSVDENGVEWFEDEDGYWWYREEGQDDWQPYDED
ncbi:MAG: hypothetical protein CMA63_07800 [Euryarchaeota archaeon]|nr:hypothetical protein [Euryarchaeota archaeon]|tara:strand:+ start:23182 stop:23901 length:720 start_codon:yes stop_codon:yes gene_type:complete